MFYFLIILILGKVVNTVIYFFLKFQNLFFIDTCTCSASAIIKTGQQSTDSCPDKSKKATGHSDRHVQLQKNCLFV